jgi:sulfonate transport system permease protein
VTAATITTQSSGAPGRFSRVAGSIVYGAVGIAIVFAFWSFLSVTVFRGGTSVPTPWSVFAQMWDDRDFYRPHIGQTLSEATLGYLWGNAIAFVLGALFVLIPIFERIALRLVIAIYCLPLIASAPILQIVLPSDTAKAALAAQAVLFTTLVGVTLGLRSASTTHLELIRAAGGGPTSAFFKVRVRSAVPAVFAGLKVAAPAAILGAVIGEFLGGDRGLGVALITSQQSFFVTRTWGLALVMTGLAVIGYVVTGVVGRALAPWTATSTDMTIPLLGTTGSRWRRFFVSGSFFVLSIAFALFAWWGALKLFDLNRYFAKTPADVWNHLVRAPDAAANRDVLIADMWTTLGHAALGYLAGTAGALVIAAAVASNRVVEQTVMPLAIALRSVPLVAMTPLIALIFGRGLACALVVSGIVTFFPSLVNITEGLRAAPAPALDLVRALGGGGRVSLWKVRLPYALPAFFASARIAAPLALLGAILAEWLAIGKGIGNRMVLAAGESEYVALWASVVFVVAVAVTLYGLAATAESAALRRFSSR